MPDALASDLEVLFRVSAAVHSAVRQASTSPHRADVVAMGADGSPTEELDRVAEAQVLATLEAEGVDWNLLSEEIGVVGRGGRRTLVVDPIDGSHNALRGLPYSTISLALGQGTLGEIDVGMVHDLSLGTTYWAIRGRGAFRNGLPIRTRPWAAKAELFFINLGRHSTPRALALAAKGRRVRSLGCASLEMSTVAEGSADAYFFENDTANRNLRVTDIAAAYLITSEAGGGVRNATAETIDHIPLNLQQHTSVLAFGDLAFVQSAVELGYL
ncbi:MAG: fructose-1,6-bisphosphatase [Thermoplasmata archaeon]|nr:fructose-1,6-bisphosphatase [Thermoplasmata archaeon]